MSSTSTRGASRKSEAPAPGRKGGSVPAPAGGAPTGAASARPAATRPATAATDRLRTAQRALVLAAIPVTALAFSKSLADSVTLPKLTLLVLLVLAASVVTAVRSVAAGRLAVPTGSFVWALAFFSVGLLIATVTAHKTSIAVLGVTGRAMGLLLYACGVILALGVLRWFDAGSLRLVPLVLLGSGTAVALYALLQAAGVDPIDWTGADITVISTLGNANFAAAYLGVTAPAALWLALSPRFALPWRATGAVLLAVVLAAAVAAESVQGPAAAAAGIGVLLLARCLDLPSSRVRILALSVIGVGGVVAVTATAAGLAGSGPLAGPLDTETLQFRKWYWTSALDMARDHPVLGVGLDNYVDYYRLYRTPEATVRLGYNSVADNAHNVPLQMLTGGGALLLLGWLALVLVALVALVRGLIRLRGEQRLLLGAVGGGWAAYQVQSLVSLDVPALSVLHFVLAASVVLLGLPPGERSAATPTRTRRGALNGVGWAMVGMVSLLALVSTYFVGKPWRADAAALRAEKAAATGNGNKAIAELEKARSLAPYEHRYWYKQGEIFDRASQPADGAKSFARALRVNPRMWEAAVRAAQDFQAVGDLEQADRFYARSFEIDPTTPEILGDGSAVALELGDAARAQRLARQALDVNPELAAVWVALGRALAAQDDEAAARSAFEEALRLEPGRADATEALAGLQSS